MAEQSVKTVAVVGCGVIGMGWATLFLAHGLKVIVSDPADGAEDAFKRYLEQARTFISEFGDFSHITSNYEFVRDIVPRLGEVDFVQEVRRSRCLPQSGGPARKRLDIRGSPADLSSKCSAERPRTTRLQAGSHEDTG